MKKEHKKRRKKKNLTFNVVANEVKKRKKNQ